MINLKDRKTNLLLLFGIVLICLDLFLILRPQILSLSKINARIKELNQKVISTKTDLSKEQEIKKRLEKLKKEAVFIKDQIIFEEGISDLIDRVSKMANKTDVKIIKIFPLKDPKAKELLNSDLGRFYPLILSLELSSGYHQLGKFLSLLESYERFLKTEEISIIGETSDLSHHRVKLTLWTFFIIKK